MPPPTPIAGSVALPHATEPLPVATQILHEERFRLLVQGVTEYAVFLIDPEGRLICWNTGAERLFGYTEGEILGRDYALFFTPEDIRDGVPAQERAAAAAEGTARDDRWHVRKDGTRFWCNGTVTAVRHDDGSLLGYAKVLRDLTEEGARNALRRQAEELGRDARMKDEFLAMLAHELRNPLAPIRNALDPAQARRGRPGHGRLGTGRDGQRQVDHLSPPRRRPARRVPDHHGQDRAPERAGRPGRGRRPGRRDGPAPIDGKGHTLTVSLPPGPVLPAGRPGPPGAGARQPAEQRREVHRRGRPDHARRASGRARRSRSAWGTPASASPPRCCPGSSTCSPRRIARWTARRAGWGSG